MLLHPAVKLGIALAVLFVSFMCFAQSGRLYSHVVRILRTNTVTALVWANIPVYHLSIRPADPGPHSPSCMPSGGRGCADSRAVPAPGVHAEGSLKQSVPRALDV